jgi:cholesterol transport system auxiliary component
VFTVRTPARTADAPGGVAALAQASTQVADEVAAWLEQALPPPRK